MKSDFINPRYDEGGFAGIPDRITNAFASKNYDAVVLFLIDGFGWRFYERFQDAAVHSTNCKTWQDRKADFTIPIHDRRACNNDPYRFACRSKRRV